MPRDGQTRLDRHINNAREFATDNLYDYVDDLKSRPERLVRRQLTDLLELVIIAAVALISTLLGVSSLGAWAIFAAVALVAYVVYFRKHLIQKLTIMRASRQLTSTFKARLRGAGQQGVLNGFFNRKSKKQSGIDIEKLYGMKSGSLGVDVAKVRGMSGVQFKDAYQDVVQVNGGFLKTMYKELSNKNGEIYRALEGMYRGEHGHVRFIEEFFSKVEEVEGEVRLIENAEPMELVGFEIGDELDRNANKQMMLLNSQSEGTDLAKIVDVVEDRYHDITPKDIMDLVCRAVNTMVVYRAVDKGKFDDLLYSNNPNPPVSREELNKARKLVHVLSEDYPKRQRCKALGQLLFETEGDTLTLLQYQDLYAMLSIASSGEIRDCVKSTDVFLAEGARLELKETINNFSYDISVKYALHMIRYYSEFIKMSKDVKVFSPATLDSFSFVEEDEGVAPSPELEARPEEPNHNGPSFRNM